MVAMENLSDQTEIDVSIIIPVYNEVQAISQLITEIQGVMAAADYQYEVIVVDDGSSDGSGEEAGKTGVKVLSHSYNIGNGAAIKTGIRAAQGKMIVMIDGDRQHDPHEIPALLEKMNSYDMVVGARVSGSDTQFHRTVANKFYNWLASYVCSMKIEDLTSGFRAVKTSIAQEFLHLLPNTFSYPTTITLAVARSGYQFAYHPIKVVRRKGKSKINIFKDGFRFLMIIFKVATLFSPLKIFIPSAIALFLLGFGYGLYKVLFLGVRYGPTSALIMTMAGLVFLIGLISEQISQLRYEK
jgi:glycosyltransferase involved in cell wall biosynthesis